jgi:hypothetical protein
MMSTPNRRPERAQPPGRSRGSKIRDSKVTSVGSGGVSGGRGIGEAPNSWLKKFAIGLVVFLIVLFIIIDFVDRANAKKEKAGSYYQPTPDLQIHRLI